MVRLTEISVSIFHLSLLYFILLFSSFLDVLRLLFWSVYYGLRLLFKGKPPLREEYVHFWQWWCVIAQKNVILDEDDFLDSTAEEQ
jgi:hypothetical protein